MASTTTTDAAAVCDAMDRYACGDASAFGLVYDEVAPRIRSMLRRSGCNEALTEDLLQQTFLQLHAARARYRRGQQVLPWVFAIARRLLIDHWRRRAREVGKPMAAEPSSTAGPEDDAIAEETAAALARGLAELSEPNRDAFNLVKMEGLSLQQTADVLGATVAAIKLRVHRAQQALRGVTGRQP
jgi:RNA polymerase sigma-70 factor, ECF subfamily